MEKELYKRYENDIKNVFLKSLKRSELLILILKYQQLRLFIHHIKN